MMTGKGNLGRRHTAEARRRISRAMKGKQYRLGKPHPADCRHCLNLRTATPWNKGKSVAKVKGSKNGNWKGGISKNRGHYDRQRRALEKASLGYHTDAQWEALKAKYQHICLCCKQQEPTIELTRDHIVPLSRGGTDLISNIQPLCRSCNSRKRALTINYIPLYVS